MGDPPLQLQTDTFHHQVPWSVGVLHCGSGFREAEESRLRETPQPQCPEKWLTVQKVSPGFTLPRLRRVPGGDAVALLAPASLSGHKLPSKPVPLFRTCENDQECVSRAETKRM